MNFSAVALYRVPWHHMYPLDNCQILNRFFYFHMYDILNQFAPVLILKVSQTDRHWIRLYFKVVSSQSLLTKNFV